MRCLGDETDHSAAIERWFAEFRADSLLEEKYRASRMSLLLPEMKQYVIVEFMSKIDVTVNGNAVEFQRRGIPDGLISYTPVLEPLVMSFVVISRFQQVSAVPQLDEYILRDALTK